MFHAGKALVAAGLLVTFATSGVARADEGVQAPVEDGGAIVNGIPTHLQPTTGALLFVGPDTKNQFLDCSGVLIGCRTVLTAAHCVCKTTDNYEDCVNEELPNLDVADLRFFFQHSGFHHVRDIYINPTYIRGTGGDLALLRLSERVEGIEPARWHKDSPTQIAHGSVGVIAGFGTSGDAKVDEAIKRVGNVVTDDCAQNQQGIFEPANICWSYTSPVLKPGDESNLCLKDDGGPLFIDFGSGPEVTGIHGGGGTCDEDSFSYSTNVVRSRDWIKEVGGLDITRDQCNDFLEFGEVGEPWTKVFSGSGTLPKNQDEKRFAFDIPKDSLLVRVTVNGDTENTGDYDLFVGLDTKVPTRFDNDCEQRGAGQFGACIFEEPDASRVNVLVRHVRPNIGKGKSRFQVTVTAFQEKPPVEPIPRGPDNLRYTKRGTGLRLLSWIDDSSNEKGFELERGAGDAPTDFKHRATIAANKTSHLETILDTNVFTYRIRAFNDFGVSEWSNLCIVNKPRPRRPTRLRTTLVEEDSVTLRWRDNSTGENQFEIQRRLSGSSTWKTIKSVPENTTTWVDNNVDSGENYEYRVRARGFTAVCLPHSLWSPVLEVSTPQ